MTLELTDALGILIAALGGAAVGLERQWSGHASGPRARFAGIRTFTLLGLLAGISGWLWSSGLQIPAAVLLAGIAALIVAAYVSASRAEVDGTTEVAALVVLAAGLVAGMHELRLASATIAVTTFILIEKSKLHGFVERIDDASLRAAFRFAVMAVVILPLLPSGPLGPWGGIRPRQLWMMVLFFSGLSFAGFLARRAVGPHRGYPIAGMLGGIISSTNVTLSLARISRSEHSAGIPLAIGVVGASAVMCVRVLVSTAVLNLPVSIALAPYLALPFLIAAVMVCFGMRRGKNEPTPDAAPSNPLQVASALQMAVLFQIVLFVVRWAQTGWGQTGVFVSAGIFGLTDMDALVASMTRDSGAQLAAPVAARAIAIGVVANTLLKLGVAAFIGVKQFRRVAVLGLAGVAVGAAFGLALVR